ncbi:major facilitator superfamily domain-containing protein [Scleroderma yunnanense]
MADRTTELQINLAVVQEPGGKLNLDIEHTLVEDDPRRWSDARKAVTLIVISGAAMIAGLCISIQNPANAQIQQELHATSSQLSLTVSLSVLIQGNVPLLWSALSEIKGRKLVYVLSTSLFILGSIIVALSKNIGLVIGMRMMQAIGSSAVLTIGAATLADIYDPHQRGTMMGIYYVAPLLGPSLGPILGGVLAQELSWRAIFWFLAIWGGIIFLAFLLLFTDTFRRERSLTYQNALKRRMCQRLSEVRTVGNAVQKANGPKSLQGSKDAEACQSPVVNTEGMKDVTLSLADVNPLPPYVKILSRKNNFAILVASGLLFGLNFSIPYTCARTLTLYYHYDALRTGLVLLSFGIGSMFGSISGGRWSDRTLARLKAGDGGVSYPEMRLESTKVILWWLPPSVIGYAWVCQERVHIAAICAMLFLVGFFSIWIYSSTLAYIVDSNTGRSSSAVAVNASFRGTTGFLAVEVAVPLQDAIGDGGLYMIWAGLMFFAELMLLLVLYKGKQWRETNIKKEKE